MPRKPAAQAGRRSKLQGPRRSEVLELDPEAVRHWRVQRGFTQQSLADQPLLTDGKKVRLSYAQIRRIEIDGRCRPSTARILAGLLLVDLPSLLPISTRPLLCGAPRPLSQAFVGRDATLEELRRLVTRPSGRVMLALEGQPGIGKTELALQLTAKLETEGVFRIFWIDAENPDLTNVWGGSIATQLEIQEDRLDARVQKVLELIGGWRGPVLIVLDNVAEWSAAAPWPRPRGSHIRWLVTTRVHHLGHRELHHIEVGTLAKDAARELVTKISPRSADAPGFEDLITYLDGYPIALELAASFLDRFPESTPRQYLEALSSPRGPRIQKRTQDTALYGGTLEQALELLWERLHPTLQESWLVAACFADAPASVTLSEAAGLPRVARERLRRLHLIAEEGEHWSMHRLLRAFGRAIGSVDAREAARRRFVQGCVEQAEGMDVNTPYVYSDNLPHWESAITFAHHLSSSDAPALPDLRRNVGALLRSMGDLERSTSSLEQAALEYREILHMRETGSSSERTPVWRKLGYVRRMLGEYDRGTGQLSEALSAFTAALQACSKDDTPTEWVSIQADLARTLWDLGKRESSVQRLEQSVEAYRVALDAFDRQGSPLEWARLQNQLACVLYTLGERDSETDYLEQSARALRAALTECTREKSLNSWASMQTNLAAILVELGTRGSRPDAFEEAISMLRIVIAERPRDQDPLKWAFSQNCLATALAALGRQRSTPADINEGIQAYRLALEVWSKDQLPWLWAQAQCSLGGALHALAVQTGEIADLRASIDACRLGLGECTRDDSPLLWSALHHNLANALSLLGEREMSRALLLEALDAGHIALEERLVERVPLDHAITQQTLGTLSSRLYDVERDPRRLEEAAVAFGQAEACWRRAGIEPRARDAARQLADVRSAMGLAQDQGL